jgi:hypothetical protein
VYEVTDALHSPKSSITDFVYVHHCCPLVPVQFTVPEDMFLRLQAITTFAFGRGVNTGVLQEYAASIFRVKEYCFLVMGRLCPQLDTTALKRAAFVPTVSDG